MMKRILQIIIIALLTVGLSEVALRLGGWETWREIPERTAGPIINEFDAVRGWKNKPGTYHYPPFSSEGKPTKLTILPNRSRVTSLNQGSLDKPKKILLVGCSFLFGYAISDEDTLGWKLQSFFTDFEVINLATSGYATFQSLLTLEDYFANGHKADEIIYGYFDHHLARNIAELNWMRTLAQNSIRKQVHLPFVSLDADGQLVRNKPIRHPDFPLKRFSAAMTAFEAIYYSMANFNRATYSGNKLVGDAILVTKKLIQNLNALAQKNQARFRVVLLADWINWSPQGMQKFLTEASIPHIDCRIKKNANTIVKGDGHPNERANAFWAECINSTWGPPMSISAGSLVEKILR